MTARAAIDAALAAQGVDAVYCINLPSRPDRRRFMARKLEDIGLDQVARWWPAVDGGAARWRPAFESFRANAARSGEPAAGISPGAFGLLLTWRDWLRHAVAAGHRRVCLLEDDIYFDHAFAERLRTEIPPDAPLVYLGGHQLGRCEAQRAALAAGRPMPVSRHWPVWGTFGLLLTRAFAQALLPHLERPERWDRPIDWLLWELQRTQAEIPGVIAHPPLLAPEVRESANMGPRDLAAFARSRGLDLERYRLIGAFETYISDAPPAADPEP